MTMHKEAEERLTKVLKELPDQAQELFRDLREAFLNPKYEMGRGPFAKAIALAYLCIAIENPGKAITFQDHNYEERATRSANAVMKLIEEVGGDGFPGLVEFSPRDITYFESDILRGIDE